MAPALYEKFVRYVALQVSKELVTQHCRSSEMEVISSPFSRPQLTRALLVCCCRTTCGLRLSADNGTLPHSKSWKCSQLSKHGMS